MMTSHVGSPHDQSDVLLLARMRSGDTGALDLLLGQYWAPLVTYSGRLLNSHDLAEDVVQEAFIRLWKHRFGLVTHYATPQVTTSFEPGY